MNRCAVVGIGQTEHAAARDDVTMGGLVREAADRAMADAALDWADIDAIVLGKAPDVLEGVMSPELFLADALVAAGKPVFRAYTSGNAGRDRGRHGRRAGRLRPVLAGARRELREAVRGQGRGRDAAARAVRGALAGRHGQPVRGDLQRVHPPVGRARAHRRRRRARRNASTRCATRTRRSAAPTSRSRRSRRRGCSGSRSGSSTLLRRPTGRARWCSRTRAPLLLRRNPPGSTAVRCGRSHRCRRSTTTSIRVPVATARPRCTARRGSRTRSPSSTLPSCSFPTAGWNR